MIKSPFRINWKLTALVAGLALSALHAGPDQPVGPDRQIGPGQSVGPLQLDGNAPQPEYQPGTPSIYGLLWLDIEPSSAQVALDGNEVDKSVWLISLPPGTHEIHVRNSGYKLYARQFSIAPGQKLELKLKLAPIVRNNPAGPTDQNIPTGSVAPAESLRGNRLADQPPKPFPFPR